MNFLYADNLWNVHVIVMNPITCLNARLCQAKHVISIWGDVSELQNRLKRIITHDCSQLSSGRAIVTLKIPPNVVQPIS
jgi:hypothetical protein